MEKLTLEGLKEVFRWASKQKDRKGRSLLERARESLMTGSYLKYNTEVDIKDGIAWWDCNCPAGRGEKPCKHVIAKIIQIHEDELRKHSGKWDNWFKEIEKKVLDAFSSF